MDLLQGEAPERLERNVEVGILCAFYGNLLTERQMDALRMRYEEDLSMGEIADALQVSRQNVHEIITRSVQKLQHYESALGLVAQSRRTAKLLRKADAMLEALPALSQQEITPVRSLLRQAIALQTGTDESQSMETEAYRDGI